MRQFLEIHKKVKLVTRLNYFLFLRLWRPLSLAVATRLVRLYLTILSYINQLCVSKNRYTIAPVSHWLKGTS